MTDDRIVKGWLREDERMALRRWAFGRQVLELGAYEGLSTMQLGMTAEHVTTVDTFDGRGTPDPRDTEAEFHATVRACGLAAKVLPIKGEFAHVLPKLEPVFGLVFVDGSHDFDSVSADAALARGLLAPGGWLAFHDYDEEHPGVVAAVDALRDDGMHAVEQANSLVLLAQAPPERRPVRLAVLCPNGDGWVTHGSALAASRPSLKYPHAVFCKGGSVLTKVFNDLWCEALNGRDDPGFTHVAMLHNDVIPAPGWADVLVEELETRRLDCLSVVVPLKDRRGLTSTGLDTLGNPWGVRRLTMTEVMALPETFAAEDVPWRQPDQGLLLNSGCWVMRLDRAWVRGLHFRQQDRLVFVTTAGKYGAESISEDWDFSRQLLSRGCRLGATRRVKVTHQHPDYVNDEAWGTWARDEDFLAEEAVIAAASAAPALT